MLQVADTKNMTPITLENTENTSDRLPLLLARLSRTTSNTNQITVSMSILRRPSGPSRKSGVE